MLLELRPPQEAGWKVWLHEAPELLAYLMGFVMVAFSWVVHHQVFVRTRIITGPMLAANFGYLFLLSLMPLLVQGIAQHPHSVAPVIQITVIGWLQVQMITLFRLLGRRAHLEDEGYRKWERNRNLMSLIGLPQVASILVIAYFWPIVADVLVVTFSLLAVVSWLTADRLFQHSDVSD